MLVRLLKKIPFKIRTCRVCGCTSFKACLGGCWWVERDLCSRCVGVATGTLEHGH